jgi:hypothetical protein
LLVLAVGVGLGAHVLGIGGGKVTLGGDFLEISGELVEFSIVLLAVEVLLKLLPAAHPVHLLGNFHGGERSQGFEGTLEGLDVLVLVVCGMFLLREGRVMSVGLPLEGGEDVVVVVDLDLALILLLNFLHIKLITLH